MTASVPPHPPYWQIASAQRLDLTRPRVMAILNITPDSFSDGGVLLRPDQALPAAAQAVQRGADLLDIGGESTRPGAERVPAGEQIARIVPVIRAIRARGGVLGTVPVSVDTSLAEVAEAALDAGANIINDVAAGVEDPGIFALAAERGTGIILMHRLRPPQQDSYSDRYAAPPVYADVVADVREFLASRIEAALTAGIQRDSIVIDPGLGFGKTVQQNLELIRRTSELLALGCPVLSAASRKSFVGRAMGVAESRPDERLPGSIAISVAHYNAGARLFRVHDVAAQAQALSAAAAIDQPPAG